MLGIATETSATLLEPASPVPVPPQVGGVLRDYHDVEGAGIDAGFAARADVVLSRRVRLDRHNGFVHPAIAQMITPAVAASATTTIPISNAVLRCSRNGLNPISAPMVSGSGTVSGTLPGMTNRLG